MAADLQGKRVAILAADGVSITVTLVGDVFGSLHEDAPVIVVDATAEQSTTADLGA